MHDHHRLAYAGARALPGLLAVALVALILAVPAAHAAPTNDLFASAQALAGEAGSISGENVGATREAGEPTHGGPGGASVWYRWTAPFTGHVAFETCTDNTFDTLLAVYSGTSLQTLRQLAANDDTCGLGSRVVVAVSEGSDYHVAVDGYDGTSGRFVLAWSRVELPPPPPNDVFASAQRITGVRGRVGSTNVGATAEAGEPRSLSGTSVWFSWSAPRTMPVVFSTCGARFDTVLGVFRGARVDGLTTLGWNDDDCALASRVRVVVDKGRTYRIGVGGLEGQTGEFDLQWQPAPCRVPALRGQMLARARTLVARGGCSVGRVTTESSRLVPRGGVLRQWPAAGTRLPVLGKVHVVVSRGPARR